MKELNSMKLSIIIPVYNVEQYIAKCLESCLIRDIPTEDYEIVVVNDGSPDNSVAIVEGYIKNHSNVRLVNRENGGLSAARNTGLKAAKGDYVWFVDSDDWIEENCLSTLLGRIEAENLDVLCMNLQLCFDSGRIKPYVVIHPAEDMVYNGRDFICNVDMPPAAWCSIYRRQYLIENNFRFLEGVLHEDMEFTPRVYCMAERIQLYDHQVYNYYQREGSIMKSVRNVKRCRDLLTICDHLYDFTVKHLEQGTPAYDCMMYKIAFTFSQSVYFHSTEAFPLSEYKKKAYYPLRIGANQSLGQKAKYWLLNLSISLYLVILRKGK